MAAETNVLTRSFPIADAADFSADQYKLVLLSSGDLALAVAADVAIGVLQNKPADGGSGGRTASVMLIGTTRVLAGAAVAEGDLVTPDATSRAVTSGVNEPVAGIALEAAGAAGDIIEILLTPGGRSA